MHILFSLSNPIYHHDVKCYLLSPKSSSPVLDFLRSISPPSPPGYLHKELRLKICEPECFIFFPHSGFFFGLSFPGWCHLFSHERHLESSLVFHLPYQAPSPVDSTSLIILESVFSLQLPALSFGSGLHILPDYSTSFLSSFPVSRQVFSHLSLHTQACDFPHMQIWPHQCTPTSNFTLLAGWV